jgi:hypothetical protein
VYLILQAYIAKGGDIFFGIAGEKVSNDRPFVGVV